MKGGGGGGRMVTEETSRRGAKKNERHKSSDEDEDDDEDVAITAAGDTSPYYDASSPFSKSPWTAHHLSPSCPSPTFAPDDNSSSSSSNTNNFYTPNVLLGSLVREEGHIYSLAATKGLLYTGSDSKNIRVWKNHKEFSAFKANSGLVKAIVIADEKIFTGHQDGKIRVWRNSNKNPTVHKRLATLPTFRDYIRRSMKPSNYIEIRRNRNGIWIKHFDAISCLSLSEDTSLLYSSSWDKTFKVWRTSDFKCLESITAHDDAVNSLVAGFDGLVFTGSADGTVKSWRRELQGKGTKHFFSQTLLKQECAVTAIAVNPDATFLYCASSDGLINFWEREKHLSHGGVLRGHKLAVLCLVTAGTLIFSGSADMSICVWRRTNSSHVCLSVLSGHSGPVKCLAVEKDHEGSNGGGERRWIMYSGSLDKSVKMWRVSEQAPPMLQKKSSEYLSVPDRTAANLAPSISGHGRVSQKKY